MTTVSLRFDDQMKKELDEMCDAMGMNLTTFFMIYAKKALRDRKIPFELEAPATDNEKTSLSSCDSRNSQDNDGLKAFYEIRAQLKDLPEMSPEEINTEIARTRTERKARA